MSDTIHMTILVENTAGRRDLLGEHGLAFWIDTGTRRVLFDTGQGIALEHNARRLGIDLASADAIVLSHGHYDHTGGLAIATQSAPEAVLYAHPAAFEKKYARNQDGSSREIGFPSPKDGALQDMCAKWTPTQQATEVFNRGFATGAIPRHTAFEDTGGPFFLDKDCHTPDPLDDDQALFFESSQGTVVLLGCAHAGVVNILRHIRELTCGRRIHAVIGGMHLHQASPERITQTIQAFRELDIEMIRPAHCTGATATAQLSAAFPDRCAPCPAGTTLEFHVS